MPHKRYAMKLEVLRDIELAESVWRGIVDRLQDMNTPRAVQPTQSCNDGAGGLWRAFQPTNTT